MDKRNMKSQSAIEFLLLTGFVLLVFIVVIGIVSNNRYIINREKDNIVGNDILTKVQKEINLAAHVEDGYKREFILPSKIGNGVYSIYIARDEVIFEKGTESLWKKIPTARGNLTTGKNVLYKTNGTIYLN